MPFDFNNYLVVAEDLATKLDEGSKRSTISRAYYSVYHLAFDRVRNTVGPFPSGTGRGSHQWCWEQYSATPDANCQQLGADGKRMKRLRQKADYERRDIPRLNDEVLRILQDARDFRTNIAALNPQHPRP
jgi:uncharacterized protein (UPF0332 family)